MSLLVALSTTLYIIANVNVHAASVASLMTSHNTSEAFPISPGFDIAKVTTLAATIPSHSWEFGTTAQALLELYDKDISVFGASPFPVPKLDHNKVTSLTYAALNTDHGSHANGLSDGDGSVGDPVSLGVSAVLLGKSMAAFTNSMEDTVDYLLKRAPRFFNGAISHRTKVPELWADWMYMVPPALAYYAADKNDGSLLQESVKQCGLYRQVLKANLSSSTPYNGVWEHIIGPTSQDKGLWSTGNAWAAGGMTRVLATVIKAPVAIASTWQPTAISNLTKWIKEIIDGVVATSKDGGLVRNYLNNLNDKTGGFGEISGSSMFAATIYRMAVLSPDTFGPKYVTWADGIRKTLAGKDTAGNPHVTNSGIVQPAVNPLAWKDDRPFTAGSPEGQAFVVLMYAAWRDCVQAKICPTNDNDFKTATAVGAPPVCPARSARGLNRRRGLLHHRRSQSGLLH